MRIPITSYGLPQVVIFPVICCVAMLLIPFACGPYVPVWVACFLEGVLGVFLLGMVAFFRDPERRIPADRSVLLAPADGTITDIEIVEERDFIGGRAIRIGIFLSILSVHINRVPCDVRVQKVTYRRGRFKNAAHLASGCVNESNDLALIRTVDPMDRLVVRQISGAIARRIVCKVTVGQELAGGERFGMIKFGSRTELYLPASSYARCVVEVGDKVKAGLTVLVEYE